MRFRDFMVFFVMEQWDIRPTLWEKLKPGTMSTRKVHYVEYCRIRGTLHAIEDAPCGGPAGGRSRALESSTRATRAFERDAASVERARFACVSSRSFVERGRGGERSGGRAFDIRVAHRATDWNSVGRRDVGVGDARAGVGAQRRRGGGARRRV